MMVFNLITVEQADISLATYTDWVSLSSGVKQIHIKKASIYTQAKWNCPLIDWEDNSTIPDDIVEAIAYYAYHSYLNSLVGDPVDYIDGVSSKDIKSSKKKAGPVTTEIVYSGKSVYGSSDLRPLAYSEMIMENSCTRKVSELVRC